MRDYLIPDEVQSAGHAAVHMLSVVKVTSHFWLKHLVASVLPFGLGGGFAYWLLVRRMSAGGSGMLSDIVIGVLTFVAVLAGFMVTLMLFTGRTEGANSLSIDDAHRYVGKVTYLLFSQALTLGYHILCIISCIAWLVLQATDIDGRVSTWVLVVAFGMLSLSMFRGSLLPFQIYEVHSFELAAMVEGKRKQLADQLIAERQEGKNPIGRG